MAPRCYDLKTIGAQIEELFFGGHICWICFVQERIIRTKFLRTPISIPISTPGSQTQIAPRAT